MKLSIILVPFFIFSVSAFAKTEVWKMGDRFFEFNRDEKSGLLISKSCLGKNCEAKNFLKKVSFKNMSAQKFSGGKNPGAVLCHEDEKAEVIYLKDLKGNDNSFCLFKDKSMVSSSSIESEAKKNDAK